MSGRPFRHNPKIALQVYVENDSYLSIIPLFTCGLVRFRSFSSFVETVLFLSKSIYVEDRGNRLIADLRRAKAQRVMHLGTQQRQSDKRRLHVTIDREACEFIDMLRMRYPQLFSSRGEIISLIFDHIGARSDTQSKIEYFARRLRQVQNDHP